MPFDPDKHHRRSIRLKGWDYTNPGAYVVTICTDGRVSLFGDVGDAIMVLNPAGEMVDGVWNDLPMRFPSVELDAYVIMPNHMHGIIVLNDPFMLEAVERVGSSPTPTGGMETKKEGVPSLGKVIGTFKSLTTRAYVKAMNEGRWPMFERRLWQRNYYETIIRNERHLDALRAYIKANPGNWPHDLDHPDHLSDA